MNILPSYREQISIFHFSGHTGRDSIILEDEALNTQGLAKLLSQCPNLKLVVLNGSSTFSLLCNLSLFFLKPKKH